NTLISQAISKEILREHLSVYFKYVDQDYKDLQKILGVDPLEITILKCGTFAEFNKRTGKKLRKVNPAKYDVMELLATEESVDLWYQYRGGGRL
ncbi:MAG: auxin-responsive protein, partial [Anaerotignum sp.]|nr:auxin-responsive protein [Anaerotignum sp.]